MGHKSAGPKWWRNSPICLKRSVQDKALATRLLHCKLILLCSFWPMMSASFPVRESIFLIVTFQSSVDKCNKYCHCLYCLSVFPHRVAKECWLKNPQQLSGAAWLLLAWSGALLREAASFFLYHLRLWGPQSCVSQLWKVHFVRWLTGRVKQPPVRGRRCTCVFNVLEVNPGCLDGTSLSLTVTIRWADEASGVTTDLTFWFLQYFKAKIFCLYIDELTTETLLLVS